jgi:hypothetical protein
VQQSHKSGASDTKENDRAVAKSPAVAVMTIIASPR